MKNDIVNINHPYKKEAVVDINSLSIEEIKIILKEKERNLEIEDARKYLLALVKQDAIFLIKSFYTWWNTYIKIYVIIYKKNPWELIDITMTVSSILDRKDKLKIPLKKIKLSSHQTGTELLRYAISHDNFTVIYTPEY